MGTFKNQKDKVVGSAKEKIGELINKEELKDEQAEAEAKNQDLTKERTEKNERKKAPLPEAEHIPNQQKIDEQRMKHYTGIEEKL